jgi:hypothetical protein
MPEDKISNKAVRQDPSGVNQINSNLGGGTIRAKTRNREGRGKKARKQVLENRKITREEIAKRTHQIRLELRPPSNATTAH